MPDFTIPRPEQLFASDGTAFDVDLSDKAWHPGLRQRPKVSARRLRWTRVAVFGRDDWTCLGCGLTFAHDDLRVAAGDLLPWREFPEELVEPHRRVPWLPADLQLVPRVEELQLDHVTPYIHGGPFKVANLRALCATCNVRRGTGEVA